jgi:phenylacetic acid degradation operon negative regulatory protein
VSEARRANQPAQPQAGPDPDGLGLRPLTARSVILSVLLGTHPPLLPVRSLVRTAELFGINEGTTRVALSRLVNEGDVVADAGRYGLSDRLTGRQRRLDEGRHPATRPWRGGWEMAVLEPGIRAAVERAAVGSELAALRLAELRRGVWIRPANLRRDWPSTLDGKVWRFEARALAADADGGHLVGRLWDLAGWSERAEALMAALTLDSRAPRRFGVAAAIVRHLEEDPLLPAALLPDGWPGPLLRESYAGYERELGELLRRQRARHG